LMWVITDGSNRQPERQRYLEGFTLWQNQWGHTNCTDEKDNLTNRARQQRPLLTRAASLLWFANPPL
jgi:hypothetical protein